MSDLCSGEKDIIEVVRRVISCVEDVRVQGRTYHLLFDIVVLALCGVIAGCEGWQAIWLHSRDREEWFRRFLTLEHGIPHPDTFRRVFERLDSDQFQEVLFAVADSLRESFERSIISIDGKTLRRSFDKLLGQKSLHIVSAYEGESGMTLAQVSTDAKSNEITAIPDLLDKLDIADSVVTADAMACQVGIVEKIHEKGADYVICLKGNQGTLHQQVREYFLDTTPEYLENLDFSSVSHTVEKGHGRIEERYYVIVNDVEWVKRREKWTGLKSIGMVISRRTQHEKTSEEKRFFITSITPDVALFERATRGHWMVENGSHYVLDVTFHEDKSRIRRDNSPENYAVLRRLANGLLRNEKTEQKRSIKQKIALVNRDTCYLEKVLQCRM